MIRFHNTLTRTLEPFEPLLPGRVGLYTCGPTVYARAHIGNFRTFVWEDLLRRFLEARQFEVRQVMNITDIDDKTIAGARAEGVALADFTERYTAAFFEDVDSLSIRRATVYPRATEHVPEMLALLERLQARGVTYASDGSVYYRIGQFPGYGRLSGKDKDLGGLRAGASGRVDADEYDKDDARDFVLWKSAKPGEPSWPGPTGPGRPGWHLECSAMSMKYLGESFDIHCGGVDNIFPHHENEIAQSEAATGRPLARVWLHAAHLIVDGEKMSKSRGNFYTLRDLLAQGHAARTLRYFLLSVHYRRTLDLTQDALVGAGQSLGRLDDLARRLGQEVAVAMPAGAGRDIVEAAAARFHESLDDDLNAAGALGALFEMVRELNSRLDARAAGEEAVGAARALLADFETVFGISLAPEESLPESLAALLRAREQARAGHDWAEADRLRDLLAGQGILVEDTPHGPRWKRAPRH